MSDQIHKRMSKDEVILVLEKYLNKNIPAEVAALFHPAKSSCSSQKCHCFRNWHEIFFSWS